MKSEKEKMLAGELYNAADPELVVERHENEQEDSETNRRIMEVMFCQVIFYHDIMKGV